MVTKEQVLARVRAFEKAVDLAFTDDEVKGILCSTFDAKSPVYMWEEQCVMFCVRALGERDAETPDRSADR